MSEACNPASGDLTHTPFMEGELVFLDSRPSEGVGEVELYWKKGTQESVVVVNSTRAEEESFLMEVPADVSAHEVMHHPNIWAGKLVVDKLRNAA